MFFCFLFLYSFCCIFCKFTIFYLYFKLFNLFFMKNIAVLIFKFFEAFLFFLWDASVCNYTGFWSFDYFLTYSFSNLFVANFIVFFMKSLVICTFCFNRFLYPICIIYIWFIMHQVPRFNCIRIFFNNLAKRLN